MVTDVNRNYWYQYGDAFAMYSNNESLYCVQETNTMLYVNETSIFFLKREI